MLFRSDPEPEMSAFSSLLSLFFLHASATGLLLPFSSHIFFFYLTKDFFFRRNLSLCSYITLLPRTFLPPWVCLWKASLMGPRRYYRRLPLLLYTRLLPKLPPLLPSRYLERVLMLKGLVRLHPCLLRDLLLQRAPFLPSLFRPRLLLSFCR